MTAGGDSVLELFERALELEEAERAAFLEDVGQRDPEARRELEELLALEARTTDVLEPLPTAFRATLPGAGEHLGGYRLIRPIGTGGMGAVYEAEQENPKRIVALKIMRPEAVTPDARRRFQHEAEVLAHLRHPGIAQIHEAGLASTAGDGLRDVPFFAMEYVEGAATLIAFARERSLSLRERLELFLEVCDAVHHGHCQGVVHRDLKPGNLLVGSDGRPKVIDFGIARATESDFGLTAVETGPGQLLGTLPYMSPEQLEMDHHAIDTRADLYALGVVLYELLCGRMPYEVQDRPLHEALRTIRDEPPARPPEQVPRDVSAILYKALEKERERRYASVAALADDIRRYLSHETVEARPPSLTYQMRMFTRRHRSVVAATVVVFVALTAALVVSLRERSDAIEARNAEAQARTRADTARDDAIDARNAESQARALADAARDDALAARDAEVAARSRADALFTELLDRNLTLVFEYAERLRDVPAAAGVGREMVTAAVGDLQRLRQQAATDTQVRLQIAEAELRLGDALGNPAMPNAGDMRGAEELFRRVVEEARTLAAEDGGSRRARALLAAAHERVATVAGATGRRDDEEQNHLQALEILVQLVVDDPTDRHSRRDIARRLGDLAQIAGSRRDTPRAEALLDRQREQLDVLLAEEPDDTGMLGADAFHHSLRAALHYVDGDYELALAGYRRAAELRRRCLELEPGHGPDLMRFAESLMWAGSMELLLEDLRAAEGSFDEAWARLQELAAADPESRQPQPLLVNIGYSQGRIQVQLAEASTGSESTHHWRQARDWFHRSEDIYAAMEAEGYLPHMLGDARDRVRHELARCEEQLAGATSP